MEPKLLILPTFLLLSFIFLLLSSCAPIKELHRNDPYSGPSGLNSPQFNFNPELQTIVILASNSGTEIFDLMAPYEIFARTQLLNVFVIAKEKSVIPLWKGLYLMPHLSFEEFDQLKVSPDLMVIPALANPDDDAIITWLTKNRTSETYLLSVCEGARVVANSQLFQNSRLTTHHSSINKIEKNYPHLQWIRGQKFVQDGTLLSTSGVSAAVEGALQAVEILLGKKSADQVRDEIFYPFKDNFLMLDNSKIRFGDVLRIFGKTAFSKNKRLGVFIPDLVSELQLAAIIDTYNRTFPRRLESLSFQNKPVRTKHGLSLIPTTSYKPGLFDEILIPPNQNSNEESKFLEMVDQAPAIKSFSGENKYIFHLIYEELRDSHSKSFVKTVYRMLDYNIEDELLKK